MEVNSRRIKLPHTVIVKAPVYYRCCIPRVKFAKSWVSRKARCATGYKQVSRTNAIIAIGSGLTAKVLQPGWKGSANQRR